MNGRPSTAARPVTDRTRSASTTAEPTRGTQAITEPARGTRTHDWRVRRADAGDAPAIAAAVRELLLELGGKPAAVSAIEAAARALLSDRDAGALLVARAEEGLVGVLGASWQSALHIPGRYGLIQELWVHPAWRGRAIGGDLLAAVFALARELRVTRVEVGLPRDGFAGLRATEAFYRGHSFELLGARMRALL
ncbi:MAG TPA: GNAT family N-acetyltransferase [Solirubrobacteraceae bacterium]|jgi:GNAT superfamily N-acetyltransferase|nr:GNAT family N-acetyltransferase [Solirubrobacteraceae bacterium]